MALKKYIVLGAKGLISEALRELEPTAAARDVLVPSIIRSKLAGGRDIRVSHSMVADGPKLVELDELAASAINLNADVRALEAV